MNLLEFKDTPSRKTVSFGSFGKMVKVPSSIQLELVTASLSVSAVPLGTNVQQITFGD